MIGVPTELLPEIHSDEEGESYFCLGHVDARVFALAVLTEISNIVDVEEAVAVVIPETRMNGGCSLRTVNVFIGMVEHVWLREDERDEEVMHRCGPHDPGAVAMTLVQVNR